MYNEIKVDIAVPFWYERVEQMAEIYNKTDIYDLFQTDEYEEAIKKHWEVIQNQTGINSLLDCSIGTGNLTLPAAKLGIKISGSDLSKEMLVACEKKLKRKVIL